MVRILFVDDEQQVLAAMRNLLRRQRNQWDMAFALGAEAALEELKKGPFDVVVSDMRMPGMDGSALLERVRALYPGTARIVLSGHAERDAVARALAVAHQFLSKPCDGETLRSVIEHTCALQQLLTRDEIRKVVSGIEKLPSVPRTYAELVDALSRPNCDTAVIAGIVERDPAMSAKVLQLANSAYFGLGQRMSSIQQAVTYLGAELLKALALTAQIFSALERAPVEGFSIDALQLHSLRVALLARKLLKDTQKSQEAFAAGLLHDVGRIIAALCMPEQYGEVLRELRTTGRHLHAIEQERLGLTHAELGAYLLGVWGLPFSIAEAVAFHHEPGKAEAGALDVIAAVHAADAFVDAAFPRGGAVSPPKLDTAFIERAGLGEGLPGWQAIADRVLASVEPRAV